jgi:hypothetical protein
MPRNEGSSIGFLSVAEGCRFGCEVFGYPVLKSLNLRVNRRPVALLGLMGGCKGRPCVWLLGWALCWL